MGLVASYAKLPPLVGVGYLGGGLALYAFGVEGSELLHDLGHVGVLLLLLTVGLLSSKVAKEPVNGAIFLRSSKKPHETWERIVAHVLHHESLRNQAMVLLACSCLHL